jgi:hypothetical protein
MTSSSSEWTVSTLKEHFESVLNEKDKAINIALSAAEKAVAVAEANAEKWRANANEWRGAMTDREKTFLQRTEFDTYKASQDKAMSIEKERADIVQGKGMGTASLWGYIVGGVGLASTIIMIIFTLSNR